VSGTAEALLAVIAVAVAMMALVQVGAIVVGVRMARRIERLANEIETEVKPLMANLATLTAEATKTANLAAGQVERFDKLFSDFTVRVEQTLTRAQQLLTGPAREGMAIVSGIRAAMAAIQDLRETARRRAARSAPFEEEEESLFIG
jgi:hypothetical protein